MANGLRVVTERMPSARSIAIGVWVDVGSRDENKDEGGFSHFIEHMMFKGTRTRSTKEIASYLESLGGVLNAFTSREQTCFHATVLDEHLPQAVDIISDIMTNSTFSHVNMEREKRVVIEEIMEVEEAPAEMIHEHFSGCFWRGQPLGRPILGSRKVIQSLTREKLVGYFRKHYRAGRIVISAAGNVAHRRLLGLLEGKFSFPPGDKGRGEPPEMPDNFSLRFFRTRANQTHLSLGFPGIRFDQPERNAILAMHTHLGGGMASVLFQKIREQKGIAYTVYTFVDFYHDCGVVGAYLAADRRRLSSAVDIMIREFRKTKKDRIPSLKLSQIKTQMKGNLALSMESTNTRMNRLGRHELMAGKYFDLEKSLRAIDKIKADDIVEAARRIFDHEKMTVTLLGPAGERDLKMVDWFLT